MIDTNVLISAILNRNGTPNKAYLKASGPSYTLVLFDQILLELFRIFNLKFPSRVPDMHNFLLTMQYDLITLTAQDLAVPDECAIRDADDRPILRAARKAGVNIIVTGDNDFLESGLKSPQIITAAEFLTQIFH
jgi:putative PIN family toxin of toxin-antitoxin system